LMRATGFNRGQQVACQYLIVYNSVIYLISYTI
jgi:hypothetical protein